MDLEYKDCICTDDEGNVFISFDNRPEAVLSVDLLLTKKDSAYLTTTGYNRNMIRINKNANDDE